MIGSEGQGRVSSENEAGSRITLHMVSSLDGFVATKNNDVSWLEHESFYEAGVTISAEQAAAYVKTIDCYVMGSHTYEHALELGWVYGETPVVVATRRALVSTRTNVEFWSGDLKRLVQDKLTPRHRNIWLVGGATLCQRFLSLGLVDEIRLTIAPMLLSDGLRLFDGLPAQQRLDLKNAVAWRNGFMELTYAVRSA